MTEIFLKFLVYLESEALFKELVCITKRLIKETMHELQLAVFVLFSWNSSAILV